jgi:hypothetical protein
MKEKKMIITYPIVIASSILLAFEMFMVVFVSLSIVDEPLQY